MTSALILLSLLYAAAAGGALIGYGVGREHRDTDESNVLRWWQKLTRKVSKT